MKNLKQIMKNTLTITMGFLLSSSAVLAGGKEGGNGGSALVCYDRDLITAPNGTLIPPRGAKIISTEFSDYAEYSERSHLQLSTGAPTLPYQRKVDLILSRLSKVDPYFKELLQVALKETKAAFAKRSTIPNIDDANYTVEFKPNCLIKQAAVQAEPQERGIARVRIDSEIWNKLSETSKAGLIMHEALYYLFIQYLNASNSDNVRYLNFMLATKYFTTNPENYATVLSRHGMESMIALRESIGNDGTPYWKLGDAKPGTIRFIKDQTTYLPKYALLSGEFTASINWNAIVGLNSFNDKLFSFFTNVHVVPSTSTDPKLATYLVTDIEESKNYDFFYSLTRIGRMQAGSSVEYSNSMSPKLAHFTLHSGEATADADDISFSTSTNASPGGTLAHSTTEFKMIKVEFTGERLRIVNLLSPDLKSQITLFHDALPGTTEITLTGLPMTAKIEFTRSNVVLGVSPDSYGINSDEYTISNGISAYCEGKDDKDCLLKANGKLISIPAGKHIKIFEKTERGFELIAQ